MKPKTTHKLQILKNTPKKHLRRPLYITHVAAGFPSATDEHVDQKLDLNEHLIKHPAATFFVRVSGDSMVESSPMGEAGIRDGDLLIVDRSLEPAHNQIVVAVVDGEFTVKRLQIEHDKVQLVSANPAFKPITITDANDFTIWGTVTYVIHATLRPH